jgi:GR25 family glycosyltransferase involved in LPS biosynthesis
MDFYLQNYFLMDKLPTLCINLAKRTDRAELMVEQLSKYSHILDWKMFQAVDGELIEKAPKNFMNPKVYACMLSHVDTIMMAQDRNWPQVLILEDDVVLCDDLEERLKKFYDLAPKNWDMLMLGYFDGECWPMPLEISKYIYQSVGSMGTFAYILKSKFYQTAIDKILERYEPIDAALAPLHPDNNVFIFRPTLCYQREGFSDLAGCYATQVITKTVYSEKL